MVDSSYPLGVQAEKGPAVRRLKGYVSWVQYDVRNNSLSPFKTLTTKPYYRVKKRIPAGKSKPTTSKHCDIGIASETTTLFSGISSGGRYSPT